MNPENNVNNIVPPAQPVMPPVAPQPSPQAVQPVTTPVLQDKKAAELAQINKKINLITFCAFAPCALGVVGIILIFTVGVGVSVGAFLYALGIYNGYRLTKTSRKQVGIFAIILNIVLLIASIMMIFVLGMHSTSWQPENVLDY